MESKENQFILFQTFPMDNVLSIIIPSDPLNFMEELKTHEISLETYKKRF
jgi:hypothetical protein